MTIEEKKFIRQWRFYHKKYLGEKVNFIVREYVGDYLYNDKTKLHRLTGTVISFNHLGCRDDDPYGYLLAVVEPDVWPEDLDYEYFNEIELKDIKLIK